MLAIILDSQGLAATVNLDNLKYHHMRECMGVKAFPDEGPPRVIKVPPEGVYFPVEAPKARALKVHTKFGYLEYRDKALVWDIGFYADNGFSIPARDVVEKCYVRLYEPETLGVKQ